jgi:hypothetical protein
LGFLRLIQRQKNGPFFCPLDLLYTSVSSWIAVSGLRDDALLSL